MASAPIPVRLSAPAPEKAWTLARRGLTVFYGCPEMPRLFHYFLPQALVEGRRVLCLDGANRFDPLLIARLARRRGYEPSFFHQHLRVARAFTCFQLTELLARVPRVLRNFPAGALLLTALPDVYFDEDVRERAAAASFEQALEELGRLERLPLGVAVFSDATSFTTPRRKFFRQLLARADRIWKCAVQQDSRLAFTCEKSRPLLPDTAS